MKPTVLTAIAALSLGLAAPASALSPTDEVVERNGHAFACTGVGIASRDNPRWDEFPLKMVFSNAHGAYLADVQVTLMNRQGETVVEAHCGAPWLLAEVEPGQYRAKVMADGHEKTVSVDVGGGGQTEVNVAFAEITD